MTNLNSVATFDASLGQYGAPPLPDWLLRAMRGAQGAAGRVAGA